MDKKERREAPELPVERAFQMPKARARRVAALAPARLRAFIDRLKLAKLAGSEPKRAAGAHGREHELDLVGLEAHSARTHEGTPGDRRAGF